MPLKKFGFSLGYNVGNAFSAKKKTSKTQKPKPAQVPAVSAPVQARKRLKDFRVVELGHGKVPAGLVKVASKKRGRKTSFLGVETEKVNLAKALKLAGAEKLPKNLTFEKTCALKALQKMPSGKTHVVFASYLLNNLSYKRVVRRGGEAVPMDVAVINEAKRVLVPGGRFVAIGDRGSIDKYMGLAAASGLKFHAIAIPDAVAQKSLAQYIRERGTPAGRADYFMKYMRGGPEVLIEFEMMAQQGLVKDFGDMAKPTIYLLRKPKAEEKGIKQVGIYHTVSGTEALNERERAIVREILSGQNE